MAKIHPPYICRCEIISETTARARCPVSAAMICPEWTEPIPFYLVLLLIAWLYGVCTLYVLPVSPWYHSVGFQTSFALLSTSLFKCQRSTESELRSAACQERLKLHEDSDFVEEKFDGSRRVCRKCNNTPKPDRAHQSQHRPLRSQAGSPAGARNCTRPTTQTHTHIEA